MWCKVGFAETIDFVESRWTIYDSDGDITSYKFHRDQRCSFKYIKSHSGNEGVSYSVDVANCNWKINNNLVTWEEENYFIVRIAIVDGNKMSGNFVSIYQGGVQGAFTGTKSN